MVMFAFLFIIYHIYIAPFFIHWNTFKSGLQLRA